MDHKSKGKKLVHNLQYRPQTQLVSSMQCTFTFEVAANTLIILTRTIKECSGSQVVFILSLCAGCQKKATVMQGLNSLTG